jgi:hypothetical protein
VGPGSGRPAFPSDADDYLRLGAHGEAYFGRDVLRGLIAGLRVAASRPRSETWWGPGVLGCAMWMDDPDLIEALGEMANVCIVVTKQPKQTLLRPKVNPLRHLAASSGLAHEAFPELADYAPHVAGEPLTVGPHTPNWAAQSQIGAVREVGFRKVGGQLVPLVHAKMALLGRMHYSDEHPSGYIVEELSFVPERLWISSANFTTASRSALEMGFWTDDEALMQGARRFLLALVALSEPFGTGPNTLSPELLPVRYDDEAFASYFIDHQSDDEDEEP